LLFFASIFIFQNKKYRKKTKFKKKKNLSKIEEEEVGMREAK
jgi:hypothetical protein